MTSEVTLPKRRGRKPKVKTVETVIENVEVNSEDINTEIGEPDAETAEIIKFMETEEEVAPTPVPEKAPRRKKYLNNADLMTQIALSKAQGSMTDELAKMLMTLCARYAKHPDYSNIYSYKEDMESFAMLTCVKVWSRFNPERSNNPFAYFTQILRHAFYQYLNHEKKQREVKDIIRIDIGEAPSFTYAENYRDSMRESADSEYSGYSNDDDSDTMYRHSRQDDWNSPSPVREIDYTTGTIDDSGSVEPDTDDSTVET